MAVTVTVTPYDWAQVGGLWVRIVALEDPLLYAARHRVAVHRDSDGHVWVQVVGNNAGIALQSTPPEEDDLAVTNGDPR